jgi:hypothetical protein
MFMNPRRLGFALAVTAAILYVACVLLMTVAGTETMVTFFNSLFHAIDFATVIKTHIKFTEAVSGTIESFILAWFVGATVASLYNYSARWFWY